MAKKSEWRISEGVIVRDDGIFTEFAPLDYKLKVLNEYDGLVSEVERLKKENELLSKKSAERLGRIVELKNKNLDNYLENVSAVDRLSKLSEENRQRKEALQKVNPFKESGPTREYKECVFCKTYEGYGHKEDCEYIKLTK